MRNVLVGMLVAAALLWAGCSGKDASSSATSSAAPTESSPSPAMQTSAAPSTAAGSDTGAQATGTPEASPTPNDNLLSPANGTFLRAYPAGVADDDARDLADGGPGIPSSVTGPSTYVFELPGPAHFTSFWARLPETQTGTTPITVAFAVSATSASTGFSDAGTVTSNEVREVKTVTTSANGRWVRVTLAGGAWLSMGAAGTIAPLPHGVSAAGLYVLDSQSPFKNGAFAAPTGVEFHAKVVTIGNDATLTECGAGDYHQDFAGAFHGRTFTTGPVVPNGDDTLGFQGAINDEGTQIVGIDPRGSTRYWTRSKDPAPPSCFPQRSGSGPHHVLILVSTNDPLYFTSDPNNGLKGYTFTTVHAGLFEPSMLQGVETLISDRVCKVPQSMNPSQIAAIVKWMPGHKLLLYSSDYCGGGADYSWLPIPFTTHNPGANGAGANQLFLLEDDALGTNDKNDATHFVDVEAYAKGPNQLGDADSVVTKDPRWCGHLFLTSDKPGQQGITQMYAPSGNGGLAIFDGLDNHDDNAIPQYRALHALELALPIPASLPCSARVGSFSIAPDRAASFTPGKAAALPFTMETLAAQGWSGHVNVVAKGDFPATVSPNSFDLNGGTQPLAITVNVPASAKAGVYAVTLTGTGSDGNTSRATIAFAGDTPIKKVALQKHQRVRIYGIHFDIDSAHIQSRSEPVIADLADMMKANPSWTFEVSGHTDSDGGAVYNLGLSQRRAQAVLDDLVSRYGIARSRLVAKGYGLTRPVASNATPVGKALNRRVELERLQ